MQKITSRLLLLLVIFLSAVPGSLRAEEAGFVILPGDILHINVWKEEGMDQEVVVLPDGTITFPLAGTIKVDKMSPAGLQSTLKKKLQSVIPEAAVTVSVKVPSGHKVSVIGQVQQPGEIMLTTSVGVMQALSQVGGLTPYAAEDKIIVIREDDEGEKQKIVFPYKSISKGLDLDKDITLRPGDVIVVPSSSLF